MATDHFLIINLLMITLHKLNKKKINYQLISNNKKNKIVDQGLTIEILSASALKK